jgi:hypothetical protein
MRLNFNNVGKGLEAIANAHSTRKFKDAFHKARADSEKGAAASGGMRGSAQNISGLQGDETVESVQANTAGLIKGLTPEEFGLAQAQLAKEEKARLAPQGYGDKGVALTPSLGLGQPEPVKTYAHPEYAGQKPDTLKWLDEAPESAVKLKASTELSTPAPEAMTLTGVEVPKKDAAKIFESKYLKPLTDMLIARGDMTGAQALRGWAQDETRAKALDSLGDAWAKVSSGDAAGALPALSKIYNNAVPDGMFAVVIPGKKGEYTLRQFDDKTGKLVSETTGDANTLARQGIAHLSGPEGVMKFALSEYQAQQAAEAALAKEQRGYAHAEKLEGLKASNATPTQLEKYWGYVGRLRAERAATTDPAQIKLIDEQLASADAAIKATGSNQFMALMNTIANTNQDNRTAAAGLSISQANLGLKVDTLKEKKAAAAKVQEDFAKLSPKIEMVGDTPMYKTGKGKERFLNAEDLKTYNSYQKAR